MHSGSNSFGQPRCSGPYALSIPSRITIPIDFDFDSIDFLDSPDFDPGFPILLSPSAGIWGSYAGDCRCLGHAWQPIVRAYAFLIAT
ncbi:MAG: hypothetical protein ACOX52_07465 [Verrucomicrobiota bacterium]